MNLQAYNRPWFWLAVSCVAVSNSFQANECWANDDPRRPAAIEAQEVPIVPADVFERLRQYQNVRGAGFSGWSSDGNGILIRTRLGNSYQLHRVYKPGGRREQITFFDEPLRGHFIRNDTSGGMLLSMSSGGSEYDQIYYRDGKSFRTVMLTDGKSKNGLGPMTADGKKVAISSTRRNGKDTDLYVADPRKPGSMEMVLETDGEYWYTADFAADKKTLLIGRYVSINESYFALLDVAAKEKADLPLPGKPGQKVGIADMAFAKDGKSIFISTDALGEFRRLGELDLATKEYQWLTDDIDWDVEDIEVDPTTGALAFAVNEDGSSSLFVLEKGQRRKMKLPIGIVSSLEFSPDGRQLGFTLARPDAPSDSYSIRLSDGELTRWTYSEVGGLNPETFVTPKRIQFATFDGREIPAYYYRPKTSRGEATPVLLLIHGGPESQFRPYFSSMIQSFVNELGVAVLAPNVRGSRGYGKTYLKLDNAELRENSVKDIGGLLDWVAEQPELDESRVAVIGGSYGGYMVLASLVHYSDRINAGIDIVGIASFTTFLQNTAPYRRDLRRAEYGDERDPKMQKVFERINPTSNADKIRSALLVIHGTNDPRVPFSEAKQIAEEVRAQGRPVWTVYADNEGHGFGKKDNADYSRAVQMMFLRKHLNIN